MKKYLIFLTCIVVITTMLIVPSSAKVYNPTPKADRAIVWLNEEYAYPMYTGDTLSDIPSLDTLPGFYDIYGEDTTTFKLSLHANTQAYSNVYFLFNKSANGISVYFYYTYDLTDYNRLIYEGVGDDFILYFIKNDSTWYRIGFSIRDNGEIIYSNIYGTGTTEANYKLFWQSSYPISELPEGITVSYGFADVEYGEASVDALSKAFGSLISNIGTGIKDGFENLMFANGGISAFGWVAFTLVGLTFASGILYFIFNIFRKRG